MDGQGGWHGSFGEEHFGAAELGDARRTKRLVRIADKMVKHPDGTLPDKINDPAELRALYRLANEARVTHEAVLEPSRARTLRKMAETEQTVLVIHDTTELDFSGLSISTLGHIGNGFGRGYLVHNTLAVVAETRDVLGLAYQKLAKRPKRDKKKKPESRAETRARPDRESRLWTEASRTIPIAPPGCRWVEVGDRGADVLEYLDFAEANGKSYVVRSKHNRCISLENGEKTKLHDRARTFAARATKTLDVPAAKQRPARKAKVAIAWEKMTLRVPRQPRGEIRGVPLVVWVVRVWEPDPPAGVEPLEWILLTNVAVNDLADAWERVAWYECRWIIEEYHKALKTGCDIEEMQFTTEGGLQPMIALQSVVALFLLNLRNASRSPDARERPASEVVPLLFVMVLALHRYKQPRENLTVHEFYYALARLGGHQNRKSDHPPGWLVLWRGWMKLQPMIEVASALGLNKCGKT